MSAERVKVTITGRVAFSTHRYPLLPDVQLCRGDPAWRLAMYWL